MRRLIAAWRHWREVRDFDRAYERGIPVAIVTPTDGIKVRHADWIDDDSIPTAEKMRRFEALRPERTRGPFQLVTTPPTFTSGTTTTYTYGGAL